MVYRLIVLVVIALSTLGCTGSDEMAGSKAMSPEDEAKVRGTAVDSAGGPPGGR